MCLDFIEPTKRHKMQITARCTCSKAYRIPKKYIGKKVKCKVCKTVFRVVDPDELVQLRKLDSIAEKFEFIWNLDGERPLIEEFVNQHDEVFSDRLTQELVALEIELRVCTGESPTFKEYVDRFDQLDRSWLKEMLNKKAAWTDTPVQTEEPDATIVHLEKPPVIFSPEQSTRLPTKRNRRPLSSQLASFGDYEIIDEIARGGMGVVFKARQQSLNRVVALKMILAGQSAGMEEIQRFRSEAEAAANLDHPGIVPVYEIGEHNGHQFFSMGFIDGQSLQSALINGPLPPRFAVELTKKIAEAVSYAHECGVIHRDLKPANVLIDKNGEPRVTDFGLAKRIDSNSELTRTTQAMGSPSWMPPEQASGKSAMVDKRADVYALGAILYNLITGRPPFQAATHLDTMIQVIETEPARPRTLNSRIPADLETITLKCLEKKPKNRYQTALKLAEEFDRFLKDEPIEARPIGKAERTWRWCKRKPMAAISSFLAVVLLISCGSYFLLYLNISAREKKLDLQNQRLDSRLNALGDLDIRDYSRLHIRPVPGLNSISQSGSLHTHVFRVYKPRDRIYRFYMRFGEIGFQDGPTSRIIQTEEIASIPYDAAHFTSIPNGYKRAYGEYTLGWTFSLASNISSRSEDSNNPQWKCTPLYYPSNNYFSNIDIPEEFQNCFQAEKGHSTFHLGLESEQTSYTDGNGELAIFRCVHYQWETSEKPFVDYLMAIGHSKYNITQEFRRTDRISWAPIKKLMHMKTGSRDIPDDEPNVLEDFYQAGLITNVRGYCIYVKDVTDELKN